MSKGWQIYYNAIFGALGGLLAWMIVGLIQTGKWNIHLANGFTGGGVGLFIGVALGIVEGLVIKRSFRSTILGALGGGSAGLLSGMVGLLLGGFVFLLIKGGLIARMIGWMTLGLFLGLGQGIVSWKFKRAAYGMIGGIFAGLVGGALYELVTQEFLTQSGRAQVFLSAAGLILIGICLGSIIPFSIGVLGSLLGKGMVVILTGRRANNEIEIIDNATIGSSDSCDVYTPDTGVEKKHAVIRKGKKGFEIQNTGNSVFLVNQNQLVSGNSMALPNNSQIQIGSTQMRFHAS
jgi:hypothetical protein